MTDRERKLLGDIRDAADELLSFTRGKTEADYLADRRLRLLVERLFLVIGEAATRLRREAPDTFAKVQRLRGAIAFRNFLVHVYDEIEDRLVWRILCDDIPLLSDEVSQLLT